MISCGRSRACSASATGSATCSSVNFEYVVESIRKMRMTSSTSMNGIRLISGSSGRGLRKFMAAGEGGSSARRGARPPQREAKQVRHHAVGRLLQLDRVGTDEAAKVAVEHQGRDRDHQTEGGVVEGDRDA